MKKMLALVLALCMVLALTACGASSDVTAKLDEISTALKGVQSSLDALNSAAPAAPAAEAPAEEPAAEPAEEPAAPAAEGKVYYLNFKPEFDGALQTLAADYTAETGVPVKVVTAASGTYGDTLTAEMSKSEAPTLFVLTNNAMVDEWGDYAMDLAGTPVAAEAVTDDYNLFSPDGALVGLGYCYESYGIITNKALLEEAGYSVEDITDFASLKAVADDIHARAGELGFDAFAPNGLDGSSSWRFSGHLANMPLFYEYRDKGLEVGDMPETIDGTYLDNFRAIWDLYIDDSSADKTSLTTSTGDEAEAAFGNGEAVFYQNGTWEFGNLTGTFGMDPATITMIPIYCGVDGEADAGLCSGTENHWAVNVNASDADKQATLDFLFWLVTSDEGTETLAAELGAVPFAAANELTAAGKYNVAWAFNDTPNVDSWRGTVVTAMAAYSADQSDANWEQVVSAFVDGWAIEWATVNG